MVGHRPAPPIPDLLNRIPRTLPQEQIGFLSLWAKDIEAFCRGAVGAFVGLPTPHGHTHSVGQSDPLDTPSTPTPLYIGEAAAIGAGPDFARENHVHSVDVLHAQIMSRLSLRF